MPKTKIVFVGFGVGNLFAYRSLQKRIKKRDDLEITVISDSDYFFYSPLIYGVVFDRLSAKDVCIPLRERFKKDRTVFIREAATKVDFEKKIVHTHHQQIAYDYLICATGLVTNHGTDGTGAEKHSLSLSSFESGVEMKHAILKLVEQNAHCDEPKELDIVLVGGGGNGISTCFGIRRFTNRLLRKYQIAKKVRVNIKIVSKNRQLLPRFPDYFTEFIKKRLRDYDIELISNHTVTAVDKNRLTLEDGQPLNSDLTLWFTGARPHRVPAVADTEDDHQAKLPSIRQDLRHEKHDHVFIHGYQAGRHFKLEHPYVTSSIQFARHVATNVLRLIEKKETLPFEFKRYHPFLLLKALFEHLTLTGPIPFYINVWFFNTFHLFYLLQSHIYLRSRSRLYWLRIWLVLKLPAMSLYPLEQKIHGHYFLNRIFSLIPTIPV